MSSQWADKPYPLISTDPFSKDVRLYIPPSSFHINTNVTLTVLPRGILCRNANDPRPQRHPPRLNAIYLQAPHLPRSDIHDFLTYCQCWCDSMHHHHDAEESDFFPSIALIADDRGIMEGNVEQHRAFTPGFASFQDYVRTCVPQDYDDGRQLRRLVEAFAEPLARHLHDEIATLRALDIYDSGRIRHAYRRFEKTLMATDNVRRTLFWPSSATSLTPFLVSHRPARVWNRG